MEVPLRDRQGRPITYLRLAVTDRCNLRCFYCMPAQGIEYVERAELMTYEEMVRIVEFFCRLGVRKVRLTGGEPFLRRDFLQLLHRLTGVAGLEQIHLTTNGTLTAPHVPELKKLGIAGVNLSLDSLDRRRFHAITRRDALPQVLETLELLLRHGIPTKINAVAMADRNEEDFLPLVELARHEPLGVRFIEEMPFNGTGRREARLKWNYQTLLDFLRSHYPGMEKIPDPPHSTSLNFRIPGFRGTVGVIPAFSRTFCGTCNRIRLTPTGRLKTCLYDDGVFNLKDLLRQGAGPAELEGAVREALAHRAPDGFEAERRRTQGGVSESMATIGG